jgi:uracil-DNA glycosylase
MSSFARGWSKVWSKRKADPTWMPPDAGGRKYRAYKFYYMSAAIPWRDLPYGSPRAIGRGGTKTERGGSTRVQMRSDNGTRYMAPRLPPLVGVTRANSGFAKTTPDELAWEPPKFDAANAHDPGPDASWVDVFAATPTQAAVVAEAGVTLENDFDTPVWHRGRIDGGARVLVIAQNTSFDSFVGGRTLLGDEGQHINHMLDKIGVTPDRYVMITPYPFAVPKSYPAADLATLTATPSLAAARTAILTKILAEHPIEVVLLYGAAAETAFAPVAPTFTGAVIGMKHPTESGAYATWNAAMKTYDLLDGVADPSLTTYKSAAFATSRAQIPREDLPYGKPLWFGTSGSPSQMPDAHWMFWNAPRWVSSEPVDG